MKQQSTRQLFVALWAPRPLHARTIRACTRPCPGAGIVRIFHVSHVRFTATCYSEHQLFEEKERRLVQWWPGPKMSGRDDGGWTADGAALREHAQVLHESKRDRTEDNMEKLAGSGSSHRGSPHHLAKCPGLFQRWSF